MKRIPTLYILTYQTLSSRRIVMCHVAYKPQTDGNQCVSRDLFLRGEGVYRLEKRNAGQGFGTKPPSARHFLCFNATVCNPYPPSVSISAAIRIFSLCDCSCRIGRFRCTYAAVRRPDGGKVCGANTLGAAEEDLTRNGEAARPCNRRGYGLS